jgi:hypothetical protein
VTVEQTGRYHTDEQVNHATWYFSAPDRSDYRTVRLSFRCIFPQELLLLLQAGQLSLDVRYGSLTRDVFASDSPLQVCVCGIGSGG